MAKRTPPKSIHAIRANTEKHLGMSVGDWRVKERQEWRAVVNAIKAFNFGELYT
jgi:hypothetical protein